MIHCKTNWVFLPVNGDIVIDKVCDLDDDRVAFADIDCRPGELPIDGHQRFRVAKSCHIRISISSIKHQWLMAVDSLVNEEIKGREMPTYFLIQIYSLPSSEGCAMTE